MTIKHTNQISNGKLSTSKMAVGDSFVGEIVDMKEGKFGPIAVIKINGQDVTVFPSGNLKFFIKDVLDGKTAMEGKRLFTRLADVQIKGYAASQFQVAPADQAEAAATAAPTGEASVAEKLAAIRAKRTQA